MIEQIDLINWAQLLMGSMMSKAYVLKDRRERINDALKKIMDCIGEDAVELVTSAVEETYGSKLDREKVYQYLSQVRNK